jgi:DnaJ-class molecular chaperone
MAKIPGTAFETETCSRCGGSGEYSYCEMHGKTCFKCHGKGRTLTKRAQIAHAWEQRQNMVPASTVQVGQRIKSLGCTITVREIEVSTSKYLKDGEWISCGLSIRGQTHGVVVSPETEVQLISSHADQVALRLRAIEYQNSLTKAGTPRKMAA